MMGTPVSSFSGAAQDLTVKPCASVCGSKYTVLMQLAHMREPQEPFAANLSVLYRDLH